MPLNSYSTGTVAIANGATVIVGSVAATFLSALVSNLPALYLSRIL
jgi:hypothetical protein